MDDQFKNAEKEFQQLRDEFDQKRLSEPDFKKKLKELRLQDQEGRFWTIGAQTGKWYCFDGHDWIESKPPSVQDKRAICVHCGFENDLENEACAYCGERLITREDEEGEQASSCPNCGRKLDKFSFFCPDCDKTEDVEEDGEKTWEPLGELEAEPLFEEEPEREEQVLRSILPFSFALFLGSLGLLIGIVMGAFTGSADFFPGVVGVLPSFMRELHGSLIGGILFGLFGGILGFIVIGLAGFLTAMLFNLILSFIGGIKLHLD